MNKIAPLLLILLFSISPIVSAVDMNVIDEISFYPGSTIEIEIDLHTEKETQIKFMYPTVTPDDEGFCFSYDNDSFSFTGNKTVILYMSTNIALMPDTYIISIPYEYKEESSKKESKTIYITGTRGEVPPTEEEDEGGEDTPPVYPPVEEKTEEKIEVVGAKDSIKLEWLLVPVLLLALILSTLFIFKKKKETRKK